MGDPEKCESRGCNERAVMCNDDGKWLCEDCAFEEACEEIMPREEDDD